MTDYGRWAQCIEGSEESGRDERLVLDNARIHIAGDVEVMADCFWSRFDILRSFLPTSGRLR